MVGKGKRAQVSFFSLSGTRWHWTSCHLGQVGIGQVGLGQVDLGQIDMQPMDYGEMNGFRVIAVMIRSKL